MAKTGPLSVCYDKEFVNPLDDDFTCLICQVALREPVLTRCAEGVSNSYFPGECKLTSAKLHVKVSSKTKLTCMLSKLPRTTVIFFRRDC